MSDSIPTVEKFGNRYIVRCNALILATSNTAQGIANYLEKMSIIAYWNIRNDNP